MTTQFILDLGEFSFAVCVCARRADCQGDLFALKIKLISEISLLILPSLSAGNKCFYIKPKWCLIFLVIGNVGLIVYNHGPSKHVQYTKLAVSYMENHGECTDFHDRLFFFCVFSCLEEISGFLKKIIF